MKQLAAWPFYLRHLNFSAAAAEDGPTHNSLLARGEKLVGSTLQDHKPPKKAKKRNMLMAEQ